MADWVPIDDPNDPRLANTPLNQPAASAPQAPTIDFQPAAPASTGEEIQFQPAAPPGPRGGDHRDLVTQSLLDHGVKPVAAAAILGDIQQESGFDPHNVSDHGTSFGLLQVGGPMFRQFNQDQARQGISPGDPQYVYNQAPFIIKKFAQQHPDRWEAIQNAQDAPTALQIFRGTKDWGYGIAGKRYQYAQNYQQALSGVPVQQVDTYTRVEKAVPVTEVEHQVSRALPVNGARPPLPATDTLNAPPVQADQINFTPATTPQPQDGIDFTPAQDILAPAGEERVSAIASDLLQDPNAPPAQVAPTPTGELPPQPAQPDWTSGYGVVKPLGLFQDPNESQNFLTQGQRQAVDTAGQYVQTGIQKATEFGISHIAPIWAARTLLPESNIYRQFAEATAQGAGKFVGSQATLENVAIAAALGIPGIPAAASRVISAGFAAQMAQGLPDTWKAIQEAPDFKSKVVLATEGIGQLLLTAAATKHAVTDVTAIPGAAPGIKPATPPVLAAPGAVPVAAAEPPAPAPTGDFGFENIKIPGETARVQPEAAPPATPTHTSQISTPPADARTYIAQRVSEGLTREQALSEWQQAVKDHESKIDKALPTGSQVKTENGVFELEPDGMWRATEGGGGKGVLINNPEGDILRIGTGIEGKALPKGPVAAPEAGPAPAPPTEPPGSAWTGIPFMSQDRVKTSLEQMGYTPEQIEGMTKSELAAIDWQGGAPAADVPVPAAPVAKPPEPTGPAPGVAPIPAPAALGEPTLPRDLTGAKPRYNYNLNSFQLKFESDLDKAAYISAQATRSKADARYVKFVADSTGLKEKEIRALGQQIRDRIKPMAKAASAQVAQAGVPRTITVPGTAADFVQRKAAVEMVDARRTQVEAAGGVDLLHAIIEEGGFPARGTKGYKLLSGELGALADMARGAKLYGQRGMMMGKLFNKASKGTDALLLRLRARGFDIEHPHELIDRTIERLRTGIPDMALPAQAAALHGPEARLARDEPGFQLAKPESVEEQKTRMAAEKANAELRAIAADKAAKVKYGWKQKITGTTGDLGQGSLIGQPEDLFAPAPPKPTEIRRRTYPSYTTEELRQRAPTADPETRAKMEAEIAARESGAAPVFKTPQIIGEPRPAAPRAPVQTDFKFARGEGSVAPGSNRRYTLPDETRQRFQPVQTDSPGFSGLRWHIGSQTGIPVDEVHLPQVRDVAGRLPRTSGERNVRDAHTLAELYSDGLSWYRGENGAHVPVRGVSDGSRIFLHADMLDGPTSRPVHLVAAHEIAHVMENLHPDLYADLLKHADTTKGGAYIENRLAKGYTPEQLQHELVADLVADTLADPTRMRQAMGETPGLFSRVATYIRDFIDHTLRKLGLRKDASASGLVENLKAARADVMKALEQARGRRAPGEPAPPKRYSLDEPPSQAELEAAANDKEKMRGHIATIQRMTEVSPDVKARVESLYTPTTLDAVNKAANETINKVGMGKATDAFMRSRTTDANTMALGHNVALRLDEQGHYEDAAMVREKMAEKLTTPAQSLWYISTIGKTSPEGLIRTAQTLVTQLVKPEAQPLLDQINRLRAQIAALKDKTAKEAAIKIAVRQLEKVNVPGQRVSPDVVRKLLERHAAGDLNEDQLAQALTKYFKIPRLTPENIAKIKAAQKAWADVPDDNPVLKQIRAADMMDSVYGLVPRTFWDKVRAASVISMIMHGKLPLRIGASSALRLAGQTVVDGIQNFIPDMGNIFSGKSTRTGGQVRGIIEGLYDPIRAYRAGYTDARIRGLAMTPSFKEGMHSLLTRANIVNRGIIDATSKMNYGMHTFSSRFGRLMENTTAVLHNVMPLAFYDAAYRSSLYRQMRAARVAIPDADMVFNAHLDANKVISNNPTMLFQFAKQIRKGLDLPTAKITKGKYGLGTALLPFALKPASLLTEGATWTPLGLGAATAELLRPVFNKGEPIRPKEVGDALIKAALGTGLLVGAGYQLGKIGVLTGAPDENKELEAMRRASGWGGYKINASELKRRAMSWDWHTKSDTPAEGDYIVNYNWLEPAAFPIAAGADLAQSEKNRLIDIKRGRITTGAVMSAAGAGVQSLTDAPMLQGVQQFAQAIGEKDYARAVVGLGANIPGNFVPALVRQTSQYMDNTVREARGTFSGPVSGGRVVDREASYILTQIPGLEQRYPPKYDVFGEAVQRYNYGNNSLINVFFNPAMVSKFKSNPQLAEMQRLYEATGTAKGEPRQVPASLFINGKQVELTNEQVAGYQRYVGKESSAVITRLLAAPKFAAEPMQVKQSVISQVLSAVNTAAKIDLFGDAPVKVGMGMKGPTLSKPSALDIGALLEARRQGYNRPPGAQPAGPLRPAWQLAPPPPLPSLAP